MSSGIMPPISLDLSAEERRNLVLRVRYGQQGQKVRPEPQGSLLVIGQSVNQSSKSTSAPQLTDLLNKSQYHLTVKESPMPMPSTVANTSVSSPSVLPKIPTGAFGLSPAPLDNSIHPTTPRDVKLAPGNFGNTALSDEGEAKESSLGSLLKEGITAKTSVSRGDFGGIPKPHSGQIGKMNSTSGVREPKHEQEHAEGRSPTKSCTRRKSNVDSGTGSTVSSHLVKTNALSSFRSPQADVTGFSSFSQGGATESHMKPKDTSLSKRPSNTGQKTSPQTSRTALERRASFGKSPVTSRPQLGRRASNGGKAKTGTLAKRRPSKPLDGVMKEEVTNAKDADNNVTVFRKFREMPKSRPKTICFDYPGVHLTHVDVKNAIVRMMPDAFDADRVSSVQFENVNVKLGTGGLPNRWLIEVKDFATRNKLIKGGLNIIAVNESSDGVARKTKHVTPKLYDMVAMEEYKLFLRKTAADEKLQSVILMNAGRGQTLLANLL